MIVGRVEFWISAADLAMVALTPVGNFLRPGEGSTCKDLCVTVNIRLFSRLDISMSPTPFLISLGTYVSFGSNVSHDGK